ncbi:armadillo-type protein [Absidia repens]|uniref:Importin subunit alpha n=1 Tax=Absidia repens TaxID=90262 RepID=A0A1X2II98_9FUNG|nr:armadillo-type protein [Absidia repens]
MDNDSAAISETPRNVNFKNKDLFRSDQVKRWRLQRSVEIRKETRKKFLDKRRALTSSRYMDGSEDTLADQSQNETELHKQMEDFVKAINTNDVEQQYTAFTYLRKLISMEENSLIQQVIDADIVLKVVEALESTHELLQYESLWIIINVASGSSTQTEVVIQAGAIPVLVKILSSDTIKVKELAAWALGNIAGNDPESRDCVLEHGALVPLLAILREHGGISMARIVSWVLLNLCRGLTAQSNWDIISPTVASMTKLLYHSDEFILSNLCWVLHIIIAGKDERIQTLVDSMVCGRLVELLAYPSIDVQVAALHLVGVITSGTDVQTQVTINCGALPALSLLLGGNEANLRKLACWVLSNITGGNSAQLQAVIENNIIPLLTRALADGDLNIRNEACWAIVNATFIGLKTPRHIDYMVSHGCIKALCDVLAIKDNRTILLALKGLENILLVGYLDRGLDFSEPNWYAVLVEQWGGVDSLQLLQTSDNKVICKKAYEIYDIFFSDDNEQDIINSIIDAISDSTHGFQFQSDDNITQSGCQFDQP